MKVSTNEVMFHEALRNGTSLLGPGITQPVQSIFYFNLGTRFGTYWGLERRLFTNAITGKTTSTEYDRLNPASPYYKPDYTVDDYRDTAYTALLRVAATRHLSASGSRSRRTPMILPLR